MNEPSSENRSSPADLPVTLLPEPRSMTIADLLTLIAGFAIAIKPLTAMQDIRRLETPNLLLILLFLALVASVNATALVIFERQMVYRRPPRPAEWIAIMFTVVWILDMLPSEVKNVDTLGDTIFGQDFRSSYWTGRWVQADAALLAIALALGGLAVVGRRLPPWAKTLALAALVLIWFWGLVAVMRLQFPQRTAPPIGSEPFQPRWLVWVYVEAFNVVTTLPTSLTFGIPAVAALLDWRAGTRRWVWTERLGELAALTLGLIFLGILYWPDPSPSEDRIVLRIVMPFWILAVAGVSWILIRCWRRVVNRPAAAAR